jgi:hypothetical protein
MPLLQLQDPYNGSDREYLSDYGNPEDEYVPPPSVVTRNVVLEGQLNIWNELRRFDQSNTGKSEKGRVENLP